MSGFIHNAFLRLKKQQIKNQTLMHQINTYGLTRRKVMKAAIHGFTADEYAVYDLDHHDYKDYIREYERLFFREQMADRRFLLDNKPVFYHLIKSFATVNTMYAYQKDGRYIALEQGWEKDRIMDRLTMSGKLVRKEMNAGGGEGFILLEYKDGRFFCNREECVKEEINRLLDMGDYSLEEYCEQSEFENNIWPYSVNTIRIITIMENGKHAKVVTAIHRFGMNMHKCVDNASAGGFYAKIDITAGRIMYGMSRRKDLLFDENKQIRTFYCHPVSGVLIRDMVIPGWESIVKTTESLHEKLAFTGIGFVAWDIALTDDGYKVIEGNTSCTMKLMQTFEGVRHTEVGNWMRKYR